MPVQPDVPPDAVVVSFDTSPDRYRHWRLTIAGDVATLALNVDGRGGIAPGYELKTNSYDLGVDIELNDAVQRLRFEHPEVRCVVVTSDRERMFCSGANIRMLALSGHAWKVNFCKFTNETRNAMEDASAHSGQTYLAALKGAAAGGGYELALACELILLVDDNASAVSLPEVALLGVLPGTGGLTRLTDKRGVRKDLADVFATRPEGVRGATAVDWGLVDEAVPRARFDDVVRERARGMAARSSRPASAAGIALPPLRRDVTPEAITYDHVAAELDRDGAVAWITVDGPSPAQVATSLARVHELAAGFWMLAVTRQLDDLILRLRMNELEIGTWVFRTAGDIDLVVAGEALVAEHRGSDWLANEISLYVTRTLKRLDVTSRSLIALIEPGSCYGGWLLDLALACDRQYMLDGLPEGEHGEPAAIVMTDANAGAYPMGNGLSRLGSRFYGSPDHLGVLEKHRYRKLSGHTAHELGLVTAAPDELDWADEVRLVLEQRAALSPDALSGMEANHRFVGPETIETKIFGRLAAWQNWIFVRPNASGPEGALRRYGTGQRPRFDKRRV